MIIRTKTQRWTFHIKFHTFFQLSIALEMGRGISDYKGYTNATIHPHNRIKPRETASTITKRRQNIT